jgi:hypothetical protein
MTTAVLLAPGPSLSEAVVGTVAAAVARGAVHCVGAITSAFPLAPWADFLAANDGAFWRKFGGAHDFAGRKFSTNLIAGVEQVRAPGVTTSTSSGVLAMEIARARFRAARILLVGFDHRGTHYFGPYINLANTPPGRRQVHAHQFSMWGKMHPEVEVLNCTPDSALTCFHSRELSTCW